MTKQTLQKKYDRLLIEHDAYRNFIIMAHGKDTLDEIDKEIAVQLTNEVLKRGCKEPWYVGY